MSINIDRGRIEINGGAVSTLASIATIAGTKVLQIYNDTFGENSPFSHIPDHVAEDVTQWGVVALIGSAALFADGLRVNRRNLRRTDSSRLR